MCVFLFAFYFRSFVYIPVSYTHLDVYKRQVQHIRGTQNVVADALSRMFSQPSEAQREQPCSVLLDFPLTFTDVLPHQLDDEELGPIIQNLKEGNVQAVSYTHLDVYKRQVHD